MRKSKAGVSLVLALMLVFAFGSSVLASGNIYTDRFPSDEWRTAGFDTLSQATKQYIRLADTTAVQWILYYDNRLTSSSEVDGYYGARTKSAVQGLQAFENITADGIVGPTTWENLSEYIFQDNDEYVEISVGICNRYGVVKKDWVYTHKNTGKWYTDPGPSGLGGGQMN